MEIVFAEEPDLSAIEYLDLRERSWRHDESRDAAQAALARTINLTARAEGALVGCVRILTDGYFFGTIADIQVREEYRERGVWRALFQRAWERAPAVLWFVPEQDAEQEETLRALKFGVTLGRAWVGYKGRPRRVHDADWAERTRHQEPWDYARFLEVYNAIARERGGWNFEADGRSPEELRERYHSYPDDYTDLKTFAEGLFIWDQGLNL